MPKGNVNPEEGDIVVFWHNPAQKQKFAINLEPKNIHKNKNTFNGVLTTTQNVDNLYPCDYRIEEELELGHFQQGTKIVCDQPHAIQKGMASCIKGRISKQDLKEIRKLVAISLGISYEDTTL